MSAKQQPQPIVPTVVPIPGGEATLRHPKTMRVKHRRPLTVLTQTLGMTRFLQIIAVQAGAKDDPMVLIERMDGLHLTRQEHELLQLMNEATVWGLLESWTLDEPLPATAEEVGEMPADVYPVLMAAAGKIMAQHMAATGAGPDGMPIDPFAVDAVEDPDSPTGASAASRTRSAAGARRASSTPRKRAGGRSTATAR